MATFSLRNFILIGSGGIAAQSATLYFLGQPAICACGYVKLWEGAVLSAGNSQHVFDWYSFTHVIHGMLLYLLTRLLLPRYPMGGRLLVAIGIEAGWEIVENTPLVIRLYRAQALALGYSGDSILNSISDTFMMALGFILAWRLPLWGVVALAVAMEVALAALIRDDFTLNLLNLIHPFDVIRRWQGDGA